jgi:hypothetical protein
MDNLLGQLKVSDPENASEQESAPVKHRSIKKTNQRGKRGGWRGRSRGTGRGRRSAPKNTGEEESSGTTDGSEDIDNENNDERMQLLDYLISPLKTDLVFGDLKRNLVAQRNRSIRMLSLRFRQAIWSNRAIR